MWMACYTQQEIAEACEVTKETVSTICQKMAKLPKSDKPAADHLSDFDPPIYNAWKYKANSGKTAHYGCIEPKILDNLLYLYTNPLLIKNRFLNLKSDSTF